MIFKNAVWALFGSRGLVASVLKLAVMPAVVPVYMAAAAAAPVLFRIELPPVRAMIDDTLSAAEEAVGRLFEFVVWSIAYTLGGLPAVAMAGPIYLGYVAYMVSSALMDDSEGQHLILRLREPSYNSLFQTFLPHFGRENKWVRWGVAAPALFLACAPLDLATITASYTLAINAYLRHPPAPVTVAEWPDCAGKAAMMVWLPKPLWKADGRVGSLGSRLLHLLAGHTALLLFLPFAAGLFVVGRAAAALGWALTPGQGRRFDHPKTDFGVWRRSALEDFKAAQAEEELASMASALEQGNLAALQAAGKAVPWGYLRVRVHASWLEKLLWSGSKMASRDEVRQIVSIDFTLPSVPERVHIEEPLAGYVVKVRVRLCAWYALVLFSFN